MQYFPLVEYDLDSNYHSHSSMMATTTAVPLTTPTGVSYQQPTGLYVAQYWNLRRTR